MNKFTFFVMASAACLLTLIVLSGANGGQIPASQPIAGNEMPPPAALHQKALKELKVFFSDDYSAAGKTVAGKLALAAKLLKQAAEMAAIDRVKAYVMLAEARDWAAAAGDFGGAQAAIDSLDNSFFIDAPEMRAEAFATAIRFAPNPAASADLVDAGFAVLDQAILAEDFKAADKLLNSLEIAAKASTQLPLSIKVRQRKAQVADLEHAYKRKYAGNSFYDASMLTRGRYLAFAKDDWARGVPILAKAHDGPLSTAAAAELGKPQDAAAKLELAERWMAAAGNERYEAAAVAISAHAKPMYAEIWPALSAADKTKSAAYLPKDFVAELNGVGNPPVASTAPVVDRPPPPPKSDIKLVTHLDKQGHRVVDLIPLIDLEKDIRFGDWGRETNGPAAGSLVNAFSPTGTHSLHIRYQPPEEYDFTIEFTLKSKSNDADVTNIRQGFRVNNHSCLWTLQADKTWFEYLGGRAYDKSPTFSLGKDLFSVGTRHTSTVRVRRDGITGLLDDKERAHYATDGSDIDSKWLYVGPNGLCVDDSLNTGVAYHRIEVTEIKGQGFALGPPPADPKLIRADRSPVGEVKMFRSVSSGRSLLTVGRQSNVRSTSFAVVEFDTGHLVFKKVDFDVSEISPNGKYLLISSGSSRKLFDLTSGSAMVDLPAGFNGICRFSPDSGSVFSSEYDANSILMKWDIQTQKKVQELANNPGLGDFAFSPDGSKLACWNNRAVTILDARSLKTIRSFAESVKSVRFFPDSRRILVSRNADDVIRDVVDGTDQAVCKGSGSFFTDLSPDGKLIRGFSDWDRGPSQVTLWSGVTGEVVHTFEGLPGVSGAKFSPDGSRILFGAADGFAYLFDTKTFVEVARFGGHDGVVRGTYFHPTGTMIATGCTDGIIRYFRIPVAAK